MPKIDNNKFYTASIKKYGIEARGVHWISQKNQELRFEIILKQLPHDLSKLTLVDAGCGFGDFYHYLTKHKRLPQRYIGIDSHPEMCALAQKNTAQEILNIDICKGVLPKAHFYICSGALNILTLFETHLFVQNCYSASKIAFIFNALYAQKTNATYNYLTGKTIQEIVHTLGVKKFLYTADYIQNDVTISLFKELTMLKKMS